MDYFEKFPEGDICPICGTNENGECFLLPIDGSEDGENMLATLVHKTCVGDYMIQFLRLCPGDGYNLIYMIANTRYKYNG